MRTLSATSQFKKDTGRTKERGKKFDEFKRAIGMITGGQQLEPEYRIGTPNLQR